MTTPRDQAVQTANGYIGAARTMLVLYYQLNALSAQWTDDQVATYLAAMATCPVAPDGSIGNADSTPNNNHPIQPGIGIDQALSSTQITQLKTVCDAIMTYINGQAVSANPGARAILNAAVGG